jgi:hypothetical protein
MSKQRFEYKVAFVDFRGRVSIEGDETQIEEGERMSAFGRRYLNALGEQGWEMVGIHMQHGGNAFHIFKRALAESEQAEPQKPIDKSTPSPASAGPQPFTAPFPGPGPMHFEHPMPPLPHGHRHEDRDVLIRFVRRGADDAAPHEFQPPLP